MFCCIHRTATAYCCAAAACTLVTHAAVRVCLGLSAINPIPLAAATGLVLQGGKRADAHMHAWCTHDACILPFPSASARCCNAVVLSHGFVASSVKQCDAHMPPTRSSEPSCETLKQPPGHLETHPRASSPRHPRLRKTALVASLLNLTWIFMITLNR